MSGSRLAASPPLVQIRARSTCGHRQGHATVDRHDIPVSHLYQTRLLSACSVQPPDSTMWTVLWYVSFVPVDAVVRTLLQSGKHGFTRMHLLITVAKCQYTTTLTLCGSTRLAAQWHQNSDSITAAIHACACANVITYTYVHSVLDFRFCILPAKQLRWCGGRKGGVDRSMHNCVSLLNLKRLESRS